MTICPLDHVSERDSEVAALRTTVRRGGLMLVEGGAGVCHLSASQLTGPRSQDLRGVAAEYSAALGWPRSCPFIREEENARRSATKSLVNSNPMTRSPGDRQTACVLWRYASAVGSGERSNGCHFNFLSVGEQFDANARRRLTQRLNFSARLPAARLHKLCQST